MNISAFSFTRLAASVIILSMCLPGIALATDSSDVTQIGHNISIGPNQNVGELTCIGCSIRVRGQVAGDVTTVAGNIVLEQGAQVAGDVTAVAGSLRLDQNAKIAGDATVVGGELRRDPMAMVSGDVTSVGGAGWIVPIVLAPFIFLGLLIALIIWLVQRARRPSIPAAAA